MESTLYAMTLKFLERATLNGNEAPAFMQVKQFLSVKQQEAKQQESEVPDTSAGE